MLDLKGNSLPKRQRELNNKVKEATKKKVPLEAVKDKHEATDVDKLFKIDLASNYKNIGYIIDVLKSGDSLHISRALKCEWMYSDTYSNVIEPDNLHQKIFPYMSIKMKKKMLSSIAMHLKTEKRIVAFYEYCWKKNLYNNAYKFLVLTTEEFKLEIIKQKVPLKFVNDESDSFKHFFGESFVLLVAYLETIHKWLAESLLLKFRHFYSVSDITYLKLIERYVNVEHKLNPGRLGFRITKDIMKKHKDRVRFNPQLYLYVLNYKAIVKCSSIEDAKVFARALLPKTASQFWQENYRRTYKYILDVIPKQELFEFLKEIFHESYPCEQFETSPIFYHYRYYDMFTVEEREAWALENIESQKEYLGPGQDFKWYQFVNFESALEGIKKYIMITIDKEKRGEMINILVGSARTQQDLKNLFQYYYDRHVNESPSNKEQFMNTVILNHNVFEFDEECWNGFNKLLYSMHIYSNSGFFFMTDFRLIVVIYNIIHGKEIPEQFKEILFSGFNHLYTDKLTKEKSKMLYDYLINLYVEKVQEYEGKSYEGDVVKSIRQYISLVLRVMEIFEKTKEECPDVIMKYIKLDWDEFKNHHILKEKKEVKVLEEFDLIRLLKKDSSLLKDKFPTLKETMNNSVSFTLNHLVRKLRIYFATDVAKEFLTFFLSVLCDPSSCHLAINTSVYGIFQLADEEFKTEFMFKYSPSDSKIDHEKVGQTVLRIQEAICRFSCYSRPPVPLANTLIFLKGDYVHYCLPMFNHYFVNLPDPLAIKFVEATLNAPLSVQKHGLRLAFKSYNADDLKKLVLAIWKKTKNISLRSVLYKNLFEKIITEDEVSQMPLFEALMVFTSEMREDDDRDIYDLFSSSKLPTKFTGELLKCAWTTVSKYKQRTANIEFQAKILRVIISKMRIMDRNFVLENIINPHINEMLTNRQIRPAYDSREVSERVKAKWALVANYIIVAESEDAIRRSEELVISIIESCIEMWDEVHDEIYTVRLFCNNFIASLKKYSNNFFNNFKSINYIFEAVLRIILDKLPLHEMYMTIWDLRLLIIMRKVCGKLECNESGKFENIEYKPLCDEYANEIGNLIVDSVIKRQFYTSFLNKITQLTQDNISLFSSALNKTEESVCVRICNTLTQFKLTEVYLLALSILPSDIPLRYQDNCREILKKIKSLDNNEIQTLIHHKYIRGDFKRRKYI
ncbi:uncharacterized protein [Battus philenor]|uniref:uncharacterized protein n=1 Tax=Battus philenor TaxID=42288 RepID=UPI0035D076F2